MEDRGFGVNVVKLLREKNTFIQHLNAHAYQLRVQPSFDTGDVTWPRPIHATLHWDPPLSEGLIDSSSLHADTIVWSGSSGADD